MSPQIEKTQFKNMTEGHVGAVAIGPKGDERGIGVEPGATVWLSEAEQILTANAPRKPEDNPFIEQTFLRTNQETGAQEEYQVTPLVPIQENRYVPANERPIPGDLPAASGAAAAQAAATGPEPAVATPDQGSVQRRTAEVEEMGPETRPHQPAPPRAAAAAAAAAEEATAPPEAPEEEEQPQAGPPAPQAPMPPGAQERSDTPSPQGEEETATLSPGPQAEETGAPLPPTGEAPQGEYARSEEVGTPVQETGAEADDDAEQRPAPYSPPEE